MNNYWDTDTAIARHYDRSALGEKGDWKKHDLDLFEMAQLAGFPPTGDATVRMRHAIHQYFRPMVSPKILGTYQRQQYQICVDKTTIRLQISLKDGSGADFYRADPSEVFEVPLDLDQRTIVTPDTGIPDRDNRIHAILPEVDRQIAGIVGEYHHQLRDAIMIAKLKNFTDPHIGRNAVLVRDAIDREHLIDNIDKDVVYTRLERFSPHGGLFAARIGNERWAIKIIRDQSHLEIDLRCSNESDIQHHPDAIKAVLHKSANHFHKTLAACHQTANGIEAATLADNTHPICNYWESMLRDQSQHTKAELTQYRRR